jgi:AcrR family transcriptional regulator
MSISIHIHLSPNLFIRNPQYTKLGRKIIYDSILLIDELGFEAFTFKKLALRIGSTEASIYRYFQNKHLLLTYLVSWHWEWVDYLIGINKSNIRNPKKRLLSVIQTLVSSMHDQAEIEFVDQGALCRIVIAEGTKALHTKAVDLENEQGCFYSYKKLLHHIADSIKEYNTEFPYPQTLANNLLDMAYNQLFFAQHFRSLAEFNEDKSQEDNLIDILEFFTIKAVDN